MSGWVALVDLLKRRRLELRLSHAALAIIISSNHNSIADWERQNRIPNAIAFIRWTKALGFETGILGDNVSLGRGNPGLRDRPDT